MKFRLGIATQKLIASTYSMRKVGFLLNITITWYSTSLVSS